MNRFEQAIRMHIGTLTVEMIGAQAQRDDAMEQLGALKTEFERLSAEFTRLSAKPANTEAAEAAAEGGPA